MSLEAPGCSQHVDIAGSRPDVHVSCGERDADVAGAAARLYLGIDRYRQLVADVHVPVEQVVTSDADANGVAGLLDGRVRLNLGDTLFGLVGVSGLFRPDSRRDV